jgi:signal peptidase I
MPESAPAQSSAASGRSPEPHQPHKTDIKETLTSIIIAFAMAFLFRGFVVEAFLIPTGSMAPTLRGQHHQFKSSDSGAEWAVGPPQQMRGPVRGFDPYTGREFETQFRSRAGDRIFVMKYLYSVYDPKRFDVVVFKNPTDPTQNFIKRLIGLPNEQVALIDGDVFVRTPSPADRKDITPWALGGWKVATKPERAQRQLWLPVFDSSHAPLRDSTWRSPWLANDASGQSSTAWSLAKTGAYELSQAAPARLDWDADRHPIFDVYGYNVLPNANEFPLDRARGVVLQGANGGNAYPVSDLRMSLGVRPKAAGGTIAATVQSRGHQFRAEIAGTALTLKMRPLVNSQGPQDPPWSTLASATLDAPLPIDKTTNLEFWHVDQTLQLWINDRRVAIGEYRWSPEERLRFAAQFSPQDFAQAGNPLVQESRYSRPRAWWEFSGTPLTLTRVRIDRDIFYQPAMQSGQYGGVRGLPALATHPNTTLSTSPDQFFVCGDNSPSSLDGRLWETVNPWVMSVEPRVGVVHRDLLIGKAFFVYFPAPQWPYGVPMPDVGKMRWIW